MKRQVSGVHLFVFQSESSVGINDNASQSRLYYPELVDYHSIIFLNLAIGVYVRRLLDQIELSSGSLLAIHASAFCLSCIWVFLCDVADSTLSGVAILISNSIVSALLLDFEYSLRRPRLKEHKSSFAFESDLIGSGGDLILHPYLISKISKKAPPPRRRPILYCKGSSISLVRGRPLSEILKTIAADYDNTSVSPRVILYSTHDLGLEAKGCAERFDMVYVEYIIGTRALIRA